MKLAKLYLIAILAMMAFISPAAAQAGCSYIIDRAILSAAQWNACFAQKQNYGGSGTPIPVPSGGTGLSSGTSGGVPYFNSTTTMASSPALGANKVVIGGGAGAAPTSVGPGTTTQVLHGNASAAPSYGPVVAGDLSGLLSTTNLPVGKSVADPGTGVLEALMPVQLSTAASKTFATADLQMLTRRSNAGSAMTDTFPAAAATGLANGARITVNNIDSAGADTITAGAGTTIEGSATDVVEAGRAAAYVYDLINTNWRKAFNTGTAGIFATVSGNTVGDVVTMRSTRAGIQDSGKAAPSGAFVGTTDSQTLTNKTISGASNTLSAIANASLTNSSITIGGASTALGGTVTATTILDSISTTQGAYLYRGAANWSATGALTGLFLSNGTSAPTAYAGTSCTNQFPRSLNASGAATCASVANADLTNSAITIAGSSTSLGGTITASTIIDSIGSTRGSLLYRGASGWAAVTPGTSGYVLTSAGAGADPVWQAVGTGATTITSSTANAFAVGANGTTNPVFNVDASTASVATGINIKGAAAAGGVAISALSSGTNEAMKIDAKGSGTLTLNGTATGNIVMGRAMTSGFNIQAASFSDSTGNGYTSSGFGITNNFNIRGFANNDYIDIVANTNGVRLAFNSSSWSGISDQRVKNWKIPQADVRDGIKKLWVGNFNRYANMQKTGKPTPGFGVLAQQALTAFPWLEKIAIWKPERSNKKDLFHVSTEPWAFVALWGIKDLYRENDQLKRQVVDLQKRDAALEARLRKIEQRLH